MVIALGKLVWVAGVSLSIVLVVTTRYDSGVNKVAPCLSWNSTIATTRSEAPSEHVAARSGLLGRERNSYFAPRADALAVIEGFSASKSPATSAICLITDVSNHLATIGPFLAGVEVGRQVFDRRFLEFRDAVEGIGHFLSFHFGAQQALGILDGGFGEFQVIVSFPRGQTRRVLAVDMVDDSLQTKKKQVKTASGPSARS